MCLFPTSGDLVDVLMRCHRIRQLLGLSFVTSITLTSFSYSRWFR